MNRRGKPRRTKQTPKGGMKGFAEARKTSVDLLKDIRTHVVAEGAKHESSDREAHKIHVSEIVKDACPRRLFYKITDTEPTDPTEGAYHQLEMIWAAGAQEHLKWQRWLAEMGDLWGTWHCRRCDARYQALSDPVCEKCGFTGFLEYEEVELEDEHYLLVGHADGAVPRLNSLVEIKSFSVGSVRVDSPEMLKEHTYKVDGKTLIDHDGLWKSIKRPLKSHLRQGLFYLWMCKRQGLPYDKIVFIYENKTTQSTKSFEIKLSERFIREYIEILDGILEAAETGVVPKRPSLYDPESKPCNNCQFRSGCWSDPDGEESPAVSAGRQGSRSEAEGRAAAVRPSRTARRRDPEGPRRHHRSGGSGSDRADDPDDEMGRASRRATRDGRGGRAVGGSVDGQGTRSRFSRQREGRD